MVSNGKYRFFHDMAMDQYLYIPFLGGWTSIYQLFWCELQGYKVLTHCHMRMSHPSSMGQQEDWTIDGSIPGIGVSVFQRTSRRSNVGRKAPRLMPISSYIDIKTILISGNQTRKSSIYRSKMMIFPFKCPLSGQISQRLAMFGWRLCTQQLGEYQYKVVPP